MWTNEKQKTWQANIEVLKAEGDSTVCVAISVMLEIFAELDSRAATIADLEDRLKSSGRAYQSTYDNAIKSRKRAEEAEAELAKERSLIKRTLDRLAKKHNKAYRRFMVIFERIEREAQEADNGDA